MISKVRCLRNDFVTSHVSWKLKPIHSAQISTQSHVDAEIVHIVLQI